MAKVSGIKDKGRFNTLFYILCNCAAEKYCGAALYAADDGKSV